MRLATIRLAAATSAARIDEEGVASVLPWKTAAEAITAEVRVPGTLDAMPDTRTTVADDYTLLAPLLQPGKIFGSGINYESHKRENPKAQMPTEPGFFSKFPSSVTGPDTDVLLPAPDSQVDYEAELAIVVGTPGKNIRKGDAYNHVFGYTLINDVSGRDVQFRPHQMDLGKGFDTFCPMGPWIVSAADLTAIDAIQVRSWINGELRQDSSTAEWISTFPRSSSTPHDF